MFKFRNRSLVFWYLKALIMTTFFGILSKRARSAIKCCKNSPLNEHRELKVQLKRKLIISGEGEKA